MLPPPPRLLHLRITSHQFVSGRGRVPVTRSATCSTHVQRSFVALWLLFFFCLCIRFGFKTNLYCFRLVNFTAIVKAGSKNITIFAFFFFAKKKQTKNTCLLSLAHLTLYGTVWPSGALYLPFPFQTRWGKIAGPRMSQQNGKTAARSSTLPISSLEQLSGNVALARLLQGLS